MMERIERHFGICPEGPTWHTELLEGAALELAGVRPPILERQTVVGLREVLRFRHFLRHAYAVELDAPKLSVVVRELLAARSSVEGALEAFAGFLATLAEELRRVAPPDDAQRGEPGPALPGLFPTR